MDLEFVAHHTLALGGLQSGEFFPVELRQEISDWLAFDMGLQADETRHRLVEVKDASGFIHDQHAVFDDVKDRFQQAAFAGQALHHGLQAFGVEPLKPAQNLIQKARFAGQGLHGLFLPSRSWNSESDCIRCGAAGAWLTPTGAAAIITALNTPATTLFSSSGKAK